MRGVPNNPVICKECGNENAAQSDRLCSRCRLRIIHPRQMAFWTEEQLEALRHVYQDAKDKRVLSKGITYLVKVTGFTRGTVKYKAQTLGLTYEVRRPWIPIEIRYLREHAGDDVGKIAKFLKRSYAGTAAQMSRLGISRKVVRHGYGICDMKELMGVSFLTVQQWVERGYLRRTRGRFSKDDVRAFLFSYPEKYRLSKVNDAWFKDLVLSALHQQMRRTQ